MAGYHRRPAPGSPDERHAIQYLEPMDARNRAALGYDMYSDPTRAPPWPGPGTPGEPALSGKVTLVQEISGDEQAGFLLYVPVYGSGPPPATVEESGAELQGFVYSPFRADDLFRGDLRRGGQAPGALQRLRRPHGRPLRRSSTPAPRRRFRGPVHHATRTVTGVRPAVDRGVRIHPGRSRRRPFLAPLDPPPERARRQPLALRARPRPGSGPGTGRSRQPRQVRVPRHHEPRAPHTAQRHRRATSTC
jgi:hypothetical protein